METHHQEESSVDDDLFAILFSIDELHVRITRILPE